MVYFIADLFMNFRVTFYDREGLPETDAWRVAWNYMTGWFVLDFASCLPLQYISLTMASGKEQMKSGDNTAVRLLRMTKLSKLLRLARLKRMMEKYQDDANIELQLAVGATCFSIFFTSHMLACGWYFAGVLDQDLDANGVKISGWVINEEPWQPSEQQFAENMTIPEAVSQVGVGTRYLTSMFYAFNAIEVAATDLEKFVALVSLLITGVIFGSITALQTNLMAAGAAQQQEVARKVRALRLWVTNNKVPKGLKNRVMAAVDTAWKHEGDLQILDDMPSSIRAELTNFVYGDKVAGVPMFRGLSNEIISAVCMELKSFKVTTGQTVMKEGEAGKEMYIVMSGELEVRKKGHMQFRIELKDATHGMCYVRPSGGQSVDNDGFGCPLGLVDEQTMMKEGEEATHLLDFTLDTDGVLTHLASGRVIQVQQQMTTQQKQNPMSPRTPRGHRNAVVFEETEHKYRVLALGEFKTSGDKTQLRFVYDHETHYLRHAATGLFVHLVEHDLDASKVRERPGLRGPCHSCIILFKKYPEAAQFLAFSSSRMACSHLVVVTVVVWHFAGTPSNI